MYFETQFYISFKRKENTRQRVFDRPVKTNEDFLNIKRTSRETPCN